MIHTVKGFSIISEAEADVFMEFSCFFNDLTDVGNLISGSSAFPKSSLYILKFSVHSLLKPSLKDFEHYFASMCGSLNILWYCPSWGLKWKLTFSIPMATAEFFKFADILSAALGGWHHSVKKGRRGKRLEPSQSTPFPLRSYSRSQRGKWLPSVPGLRYDG